ncbi:ABC transporter substrate-binding protein [Oscillospiraceae bacterium 44-5]
MRRNFFPLLLALALLAGCQGPEAPAPRDSSSVTVVMPPTSEPEAGFDPAFGWGAGEHVHEPLIQSTLTVTNPDLTIGYDLVASMEASEDGLTWTVTLRDDAAFTDGEPLTAADAAFTYNTVKSTSSVNDFTMLDYAEAVDETTVVFHMTRPFSIWPYTMAITGILPEHAYDPAVYGSSPVGSGRYILKQWDRGQQVILEANPDYYGEPPRMERVVILFMEEDAAFLAVQAGQADLAYTSAVYSDQSVDGYSLLSVKTVDNRGINLPAWNNAFTADPLVRHAINLGVDRQAVIDHVLNGYGTPAYSVCDGLPWWYSATAEASDDPEQARALLDQAGWLPGPDGVREKNGVRAALTVHYAAGDSVRQGIAAELANQLSELGIETDIRGVGWDTAYDDALSNPLVWGWGAHTPMELYNIYHTAPGSDSALYSPYANQSADELMDAALACPGLEESYALWQEAQAEIAQDAPWVWLVNVDHLYWVREGLAVAEQKLHPHGHGWSIVNNIDQWSWT